MPEKDNTNIKIFGNDDSSLKILGQLLSNETSRKIIQLLINEEMYARQISKTLGIQMNLTLHHLKKFDELGLLITTHKKIIRKGIDHKHYKIIPNMFVASNQTKKEIHSNGFLKKIFKNKINLFAVSFIGIVTYFNLKIITDTKYVQDPIYDSDAELIEIPFSFTLLDFIPTIILIAIIVTSLLIVSKKKKKRLLDI